jgi:peptidoglycan hydrolase-like protein with peptidoglycan-binding domain
MSWARPLTLAFLAVALALGSGCRGPGAQLPEGIRVIPETPPSPPEVVKEAQRRLLARGFYEGPVDGAMSPATRVALAKLQRERELPPTGELDEATLAVLGLSLRPRARLPAARSAERPEETPGPTPAPPLRLPPTADRPQPPPGALEEAREEARRLLAEGVAAAAPVPGPEELARGGLAPVARRMDLAGEALLRARELAFERLLRARAEGGWALLPRELLDRLEAALAERSLLVHGPDGRLGDDDAAAIRWLERSVGLPATGQPGLRLLEALGIDPSPMFAP